MSTYDELKKKIKESGYMALSGDERKQYQELKGKPKIFEVTDIKKEKADVVEAKKVIAEEKENLKKTKPDKEITVTEEKLQEMIKEGIEASRKYKASIPEKEGQWKEVEPGKEKHQTAMLRLYQKDSKSPFGVIIRADYLKMVWNEETHKHDKMLYEIEVLYEGGETEVIEMDAEFYIKLNQTEKVELIENDRKMMRQVTGKVGVPVKDKDGYPIIKMDGGGYGSAKGILGEVELEDIKYDEVFKVKRPNGQVFAIHSKYLNN